jgi:hypothetical protein
MVGATLSTLKFVGVLTNCRPTLVALSTGFEEMVRDERFGNGRTARQVFQQMTEPHAELAEPGAGALTTLPPADLPHTAVRA